MDGADNLNNFISGDGNDQIMDFLPIWMVDAMEVANDVAALKSEDAAPKPEDAVSKPEDAAPKPEVAAPMSEDAAPKPEDAAQPLSVSSEEDSDEEPPSKKRKANLKPAGECSYGLQSVFKPVEYCHYNKCESILKHYCLTCQGFYCYRHGPQNLHRCSGLYPPLSPDEEIAEDDDV